MPYTVYSQPCAKSKLPPAVEYFRAGAESLSARSVSTQKTEVEVQSAGVLACVLLVEGGMGCKSGTGTCVMFGGPCVFAPETQSSRG